MPLPPAIFLQGPTASGKTGVAVELVQRLPVELISVDSALVYRDMNIGTAKPDAATLESAPHHLINLINPTETYSAASFRKDALYLMADITRRGKIPLLVGGTMLYFKALREGLSDLPQADTALRTSLDADIARYGIERLHHRLAEVDAKSAARLHPTDTQRIQRAMEIFLLTGQPMSTLIDQKSRFDENKDIFPYRVLSFALVPSERTQLHNRIAVRFKTMLKQGLLDELHALREKYPLHANMNSMRCVGYRQAWQFMEGEITADQLLETGLAATRQLAKRQLTWLRSTPDIITLDCLLPNLGERIINQLQQAVINC